MSWAIKGKENWVISSEGFSEYLGATKYPEVKAALKIDKEDQIKVKDLIKAISEDSWPKSHPRCTKEDFELGFQDIREDDPESYKALRNLTVFVEEGKEVGLDVAPFPGSLPYENPQPPTQEALNKILLVKCLGYFDQTLSECQGCEVQKPCFEKREEMLKQVSAMLDQKDLEENLQSNIKDRMKNIQNMFG